MKRESLGPTRDAEGQGQGTVRGCHPGRGPDVRRPPAAGACRSKPPPPSHRRSNKSQPNNPPPHPTHPTGGRRQGFEPLRVHRPIPRAARRHPARAPRRRPRGPGQERHRQDGHLRHRRHRTRRPYERLPAGPGARAHQGSRAPIPRRTSEARAGLRPTRVTSRVLPRRPTSRRRQSAAGGGMPRVRRHPWPSPPAPRGRLPASRGDTDAGHRRGGRVDGRDVRSRRPLRVQHATRAEAMHGFLRHLPRRYARSAGIANAPAAARGAVQPKHRRAQGCAATLSAGGRPGRRARERVRRGVGQGERAEGRVQPRVFSPGGCLRQERGSRRGDGQTAHGRRVPRRVHRRDASAAPADGRDGPDATSQRAGVGIHGSHRARYRS